MPETSVEHDPAAVAERVEERAAGLVVGAAHPASLESSVVSPRHAQRRRRCRSAAARLAAVKESLSVAEARRIALAAQGFAQPRPAAAGTRQLNLGDGAHGDAADRLGQRLRPVALHAAVLPRSAPYDTAALDRLLFARRAPYVEYWAHVASFIPADRLGAVPLPHGRDASEVRHAAGRLVPDAPRDRRLGAGRARRPRSAAPGADRARREAGARAGRGGTGTSSSTRSSTCGCSARSRSPGRRGFERRYGLAEHVLPAEALAAPVPRDDAIRELIARAARAHGVATASDLADYWRIKDRRAVMAAIGDLRGRGRARSPSRCEGWQSAGRPAKAWVHRDAALPRRVDAAAILTPFDPVVWFRDRAERLFDFEYRIEIYTPAPAAPLRVLLAAGADRRRHRRPRRPEGRPRVLDAARAVGVVGARATGGCRGPTRRRAARRRALAGARVDLGVAVGRCHRRPGGRAPRGLRHDRTRPRRSRRAWTNPRSTNRRALA